MWTEQASRAAEAQGARAFLATAAGVWFLGWNPELATFWATHRRVGADGGVTARPDHELGTGVGACPSVGALEEALAFPLPAGVREALSLDRQQRPALARPRADLVVGDPQRLRGVDTYPTWDSPVAVVPDGLPAAYGLRMEQERPEAAVDLDDDTRLELLSGELDTHGESVRVGYRLTHRGRVLFAGNDIWAPVDADLADLYAGRSVLALVLDPEAPQRTRPLSPEQASFVETHGERLLAALEERTDPLYHHPVGSRVAATVEGERVTGVVTYAACNRGQVLGYAWRPDVFSLVGHPWRHFEEHAWASPPGDLTRTLAPPFVGAPSPGVPLSFGAVVATASPETGERMEAVVLRAYRNDTGFVYQVQSHDGLEPSTLVEEDDLALVRGTWWATKQELLAARRAAGLEVVAGEVFASADTDTGWGVVGQDTPTAAPLTLEQYRAAMAADAGPLPPPMLRVITDGDLTRVGDPHHGWLPVSTAHWHAALDRPVAELRRLVARAGPGVLRGDEHPTVLAALAVLHAPGEFADPGATAVAEVIPIATGRTSAGMGL